MNTLKQLRKNKGVSQTEVANAIGVSQVAYGRYESGQREPSFDMLNALADYFGVSVDAVLGRDDVPSFKWKTIHSPMPDFVSSETVPVPIIGRVRAGYGALAEQEIEGYMELEPSVKSRWSDATILRVYGRSMEPELHEGDYVIISQQVEVKSGDVAIVCINGDEGTIKRVRFGEDGLDLIPTNPDYGTLHFTPEQVETLPIVIQARVVRVIRDM